MSESLFLLSALFFFLVKLSKFRLGPVWGQFEYLLFYLSFRLGRCFDTFNFEVQIQLFEISKILSPLEGIAYDTPDSVQLIPLFVIVISELNLRVQFVNGNPLFFVRKHLSKFDRIGKLYALVSKVSMSRFT